MAEVPEVGVLVDVDAVRDLAQQHDTYVRIDEEDEEEHGTDVPQGGQGVEEGGEEVVEALDALDEADHACQAQHPQDTDEAQVDAGGGGEGDDDVDQRRGHDKHVEAVPLGLDVYLPGPGRRLRGEKRVE